jgi:hypothetical protein
MPTPLMIAATPFFALPSFETLRSQDEVKWERRKRLSAFRLSEPWQ